MIAHVVGASVLGYFVFDEALYILLDIGFVWTILLDGEMGLLPHPVATRELELDEPAKVQIKADFDLLLGGGDVAEGLTRVELPPAAGEIAEVSFFADGDRRLLLITGTEAQLGIETSLATAEINLYEFK